MTTMVQETTQTAFVGMETKLNSTSPMTSFNYTQRATISEPEKPFSQGGVITAACLLIPMAVFGLVANLITMIVIAKSKKLKSIFNYLLISLCMSDLLSALFSPLPLYRQTWGFDLWELPEELCKASFAVDAWTTYVTTLHILLFAIFRLISIQWPIHYKRVTVLQVRVLIVMIWLVGFSCGFIPYWIMFKDIKRDRYSNGPDATWSHCSLNPAWIDVFITYYKTTYPIFIYFPMAAIIVLCPLIGIIIKRRRFKSRSESINIKRWMYCPGIRTSEGSSFLKSDKGNKRSKKSSIAQADEREAERHQRKKERNALLQLGFITGSFLMGYIPNTAHVVYTTNVVPTSIAMRVLEWNLYLLGYVFLRLSECLNPIFYNAASSKMRRETFEFIASGLKCNGHRDTPTPYRGSSGEGTVNVAL